MLIPFADLVKRHGCSRGKILHIGAHACEERSDYAQFGFNDNRVIWIEGNHDLIAPLRVKYPELQLYSAVISDHDDQPVNFIITNNGQSSSILELGTHRVEHPHVVEVARQQVTTITVDTLFARQQIAAAEIEFVNIDIQGAELLALRGAKSVLYYAKFLYLEVNERELYRGCALIDELDQYLRSYGFTRVETQMTEHGWGDALYKKDSYESYVNNQDMLTNGEFGLWQRLQANCQVVFDVGARTDLTYCAPHVQAYLFEPNPEFYAKLLPAASARVKVFNYGLGDAEEERRYFNTSQSFHFRAIVHDDAANSQVLHLRRLDKVATEQQVTAIDFCKIDTAGNEYFVLKGAGAQLQSIKYVQFEYGGTYPDCGKKLADVYQLLRVAGLCYIYLLTSHGVLAQPDPIEHLQYSNYVASRTYL